MGFDIFHKYPLIRILVPMLGGIFLANLSLTYPINVFIVAGVCTLLIGVILFYNYSIGKTHKNYKSTFLGVAIAMLLFFLGYLNTSLHTKPFISNKQGYEPHVGVVSSQPFMNDELTLLQFDFLTQVGGKEVKIKVFERLDSASHGSLSIGDVIVAKGKLQVPAASHNFYMFDYKQFLRQRYYQGVLYTTSSDVYISSIVNYQLPISSYFEAWNSKLKSYIDDIDLSVDSRAILVALLLGDRSSLSAQTQAEFSASGVSHVLALSGLHVGLIYFVLTSVISLLLFFIPRKKTVSSMIAVLLLWLFALFTGLSPSVVRASLFLTLYVLASIVKRKGQGVNILFFTSLIMLVYNPYWLFDIGFQLSFTAVLGILLFTPLLQNTISVSNRPLNYVINVSCISLSAQLGTLPIVLYYFGAFPTYFLLANLVVIPLITILLYLSILLLLTSWIPIWCGILVFVIDALVGFTNDFVHYVSSLPTFVSDSLYVSNIQVFMFFVALTLLYLLLRKFSYNRVMHFLVCVVLIVAYTYVDGLYTNTTIGISSFHGKAFVHIGKNKSVLFLDTDSTIEEKRFKQTFNRFWSINKFDIPTLSKVGDVDNGVFKSNDILIVESLIIGTPELGRNASDKKLNVVLDYLYLDNRNYENIATLNQRISFKEIIYHENLDQNKKEELEAFSNAKNIEINELHEKAYLWLIP